MAEPVTTSIWLEQQLQRALGRIDALVHEVGELREALRSEQAETVRLQDELALLNGRTSRHESNLDQVRGLQQQVVLLEQRLEAEASLRRDHAGAFDRGQQRDAEAQQWLDRTVERLEAEIARATARLDAIDERQRSAAADLDAAWRDDTSVDVRLDTLERRIDTVAADLRRAAEGRDAEASAIPEVRLALHAVEARTRALHEEQQRLDDGLAHAGTPDELQIAVADAIEQVRSLRERVEVRLGALETQAAETARSQAEVGHAGTMLERRVVAYDEQIRRLDARLEAQRETLIEHARRAAAAAEDAARRQMQEVDRQTRTGRELLARLIERSDEAAQEQPL